MFKVISSRPRDSQIFVWKDHFSSDLTIISQQRRSILIQESRVIHQLSQVQLVTNNLTRLLVEWMAMLKRQRILLEKLKNFVRRISANLWKVNQRIRWEINWLGIQMISLILLQNYSIVHSKMQYNICRLDHQRWRLK